MPPKSYKLYRYRLDSLAVWWNRYIASSETDPQLVHLRGIGAFMMRCKLWGCQVYFHRAHWVGMVCLEERYLPLTIPEDSSQSMGLCLPWHALLRLRIMYLIDCACIARNRNWPWKIWISQMRKVGAAMNFIWAFNMFPIAVKLAITLRSPHMVSDSHSHQIMMANHPCKKLHKKASNLMISLIPCFTLNPSWGRHAGNMHIELEPYSTVIWYGVRVHVLM